MKSDVPSHKRSLKKFVLIYLSFVIVVFLICAAVAHFSDSKAVASPTQQEQTR